MAEGPEEQRRLAFAYERVPNKPTITATGAFGGPSPDSNSIVAQLFVEHGSVPIIISHPIREDGSVDMSPEHADKVARADATREIQATLVLSPEAAITIGEWLVKHGQDTQGRRDQKR